MGGQTTVAFSFLSSSCLLGAAQANLSPSEFSRWEALVHSFNIYQTLICVRHCSPVSTLTAHRGTNSRTHLSSSSRSSHPTCPGLCISFARRAFRWRVGARLCFYYAQSPSCLPLEEIQSHLPTGLAPLLHESLFTLLNLL